jgi:hypothetical protein
MLRLQSMELLHASPSIHTHIKSAAYSAESQIPPGNILFILRKTFNRIQGSTVLVALRRQTYFQTN